MSDPNDIVIAELCSRLIPNRPGDRQIAVPRDMPGIVISAKLRTQYQENFDNRLNRPFAKGSRFFISATNNLLEMFGEGVNKFTRHVADRTQPKSKSAGISLPCRYSILAAHRLAMLISEARHLVPDETIKYGAPGGGS